MGSKDPRVDAYIGKAADFAKPVLAQIRKIVHNGCPGVEETMKWSFPHFMYKGILCSMASFKGHCTFGFWKGPLIVGKNEKTGAAMGQFGRITGISDLPGEAAFLRLVREAARLNDEGIKRPSRPRPKAKKELHVPGFLLAELGKNSKAKATFESFTYSHKKEYVDWIVEAKTEETRTKRLKTAIEWMAQGKARNWKYAS